MKKLLIWGTGNLAEIFVKNRYNGEIIGFIETNKVKDTYMDKPVYDSRKIPNEYDYIVVPKESNINYELTEYEVDKISETDSCNIYKKFGADE